MVRISEELVRRRAEHNEGEIFSLEELSLHQSHIEKIEHLDRWCRDLRILYLQANLIGKIENVSKFKKLEYLNLAMNNITRIENLSGCESLSKLDLTLNFIKELTSIRQLTDNYNLTELLLIGNPCTDYQGYRQFVLATLPQLNYLDGKKIERSERIAANNNYEMVKETIEKLEKQTAENSDGTPGKCCADDNNDGDPMTFWTKPTDHSIESRLKMYEMMSKSVEEKNMSKVGKQKHVVAERRLVSRDGQLLNVNQPKVAFRFDDVKVDKREWLQLDVAVFKYLDTSLIKVNLEPNVIQVEIKGKMLQLVLPYEIAVDQSKVERSMTTGHLMVTMPKVDDVVKPKNVPGKWTGTMESDGDGSGKLEC